MSKSSVPIHLEWLGGLSERYKAMFLRLARLETKMLTFDIEDIEVYKPIFVTSLARSGTTVILEALNTHSDCASHHYGDYPFPYTTHFWNMLRLFFPTPDKKAERAHKDRLRVNKKSPEAIEEMVWMAFFDQLHDVSVVNKLDSNLSNKAFEAFYKNHIKKLLYLRKGSRYLAKNNYNISRIGYILSQFKGAKFVVPVRDPLEHIYSMVKQHRLIASVQDGDKRAMNFMRRHGHYEFGLDFRPLDIGQNSDQYKAVLSAWNDGNIVKSYALYWDYIHRFIYDQVICNDDVKENCLVMRYDDLCENTEQRLNDILTFCELSPSEDVLSWSDKITPPDYYKIDFTDDERKMIKDITEDTRQLIWS